MNSGDYLEFPVKCVDFPICIRFTVQPDRMDIDLVVSPVILLKIEMGLLDRNEYTRSFMRIVYQVETFEKAFNLGLSQSRLDYYINMFLDISDKEKSRLNRFFDTFKRSRLTMDG